MGSDLLYVLRIYIYIYIRLKIKPNSVRFRILSSQIVVLPSPGFELTPLIHCSTIRLVYIYILLIDNWKKRYTNTTTLSGQSQNPTENSVPSKTQIHDRSLGCLGSCTSIKCDGVKLVLLVKNLNKKCPNQRNIYYTISISVVENLHSVFIHVFI